MKMQRKWWYAGGVLLTILGTMLCVRTMLQQPPSSAAASDDAITTFLRQHWQTPIPPQGAPPETFSPVEASLHPKDCGVCHAQQYEDWQSSLHSRSMGPGVYGQLLDMDPATVLICSSCHTPLHEQLPYIVHGDSHRANPDYQAELQQAGLVCATCHVRQHTRFGPPRRAELPPLQEGTVLPHGGFVESTAFRRSEFCKGCHQFGPDDFALNGKLIENTYEEWRQSPYAAQGTQCQDCHMPERRHLWRGIHDPAMVQQAITVTITPNAASYTPGDRLEAVITVTNSGAGHYLPTYVTPKIFVRAHLLDAQGQMLADTAREDIIGREVALDLSREIYDTRIPPHGQRSFTYTQVLPAVASKLRVFVVVHPDHFYQRFFAAVLQDGNQSTGRAYLEQALQTTAASSFTVFERDMVLTDTSQP